MFGYGILTMLHSFKYSKHCINNPKLIFPPTTDSAIIVLMLDLSIFSGGQRPPMAQNEAKRQRFFKWSGLRPLFSACKPLRQKVIRYGIRKTVFLTP